MPPFYGTLWYLPQVVYLPHFLADWRVRHRSGVNISRQLPCCSSRRESFSVVTSDGELERDGHVRGWDSRIDGRLDWLSGGATSPPSIHAGLAILVHPHINLSTFPPAISALVYLRELDLHGCGIASWPASALSPLASLTALNLHGNEIAHFPEDAFKGLDNLVILDLHENNLQRLPSAIYSSLPKLTHLDVSRNQLSSLPFDISDSSNLIHINLTYNQLDSLPVAIKQLSNLHSLKVRGNELVDIGFDPITDGHVCHFPSLRQLAANQCLRTCASMNAILLEDALPDDAKEWLAGQSYGRCANCCEYSLAICDCAVDFDHVCYERLPLRTNHCSRACSKIHSDALEVLRNENAARLMRRLDKFNRPPRTSGVISTCGFHGN